MHADTIATLQRGATLVAASRRLAGALQREFALLQAGTAAVWETPDIVTWSVWLQRTWEGTGALTDAPEPRPSLLTSLQETSLWERIVSRSPHGRELLNVASAASVAQEAWRVQTEWRLPAPRPPANEDVTAFAEWAREFVKTCNKEGWQDLARLPDVLARDMRERHVELPKEILLAGFEELTPQQRVLLQVIEEAGTQVAFVEPEIRTDRIVRLPLADARQELQSAAIWARHQLEQDSNARIAIVVPDLQSRRAAIARALDEVLVPMALLPDYTGERPYNLSLGLPLSDYPVIHAALLILRLAKGELEIEEVGTLLRSSFIAGAEAEQAQRALLDVALREIGEPTVSVAAFQRTARGIRTDGRARACAAPLLAQRLEVWSKVQQGLTRRHAPSVWSESFSQLLHALGWPGERTLNSDEHQTVAKFREALATLSSLDRIEGAVSYQDAVGTLQGVLRDTIFQPESPMVPVQVLGVLEASGLRFDALWVMGLHDGVWPASPRPNPFLSIHDQRKHNVPHASAEREYEYARRLTEQLTAAAPNVVLSYPLHDGDQDLRPSPLIAQFTQGEPVALGITRTQIFAEVIFGSARIEEFTDSQAPALAEGANVKTGTFVFKNQAACPFRAFAGVRLGAESLPAVSAGLDALARGNLLHHALETIWRQIKSHADLCALSDENMGALIKSAVADAVSRMAKHRPETFHERFMAIECSRLERLVYDWLQLEKQREAFVVIATEKAEPLSIGGIDINARIDRVDELTDGTFAIIDYKTGKVSPAAWFDERPDEPQLPIYSQVPGREIGAVLFGQVKKGELRFKGIARQASLVPGIEAYSESKLAEKQGSWSDVFANWSRVLTRLGEQFRAGDARVDPKKNACNYCDLGPLCRSHEAGLTPPEEAAEENAEEYGGPDG